jgi:serine/threonine-protein kinase
MEYITGKSLEELLKAKTIFSIAEALLFWKQILRGLQYAHSHNIIHGDIKPSNIMVSSKNEVKISDFGIANIFGAHGNSKAEIPFGTPRYSSPEQILGQEIDFRSDLYSAGITFYEMVTGGVPFDSRQDIDIEIERAHIEAQPPKPSSFNNKIDTNLEKFLLKTIAKKPENRYQSALEMLENLDCFD